MSLFIFFGTGDYISFVFMSPIVLVDEPKRLGFEAPEFIVSRIYVSLLSLLAVVLLLVGFIEMCVTVNGVFVL